MTIKQSISKGKVVNVGAVVQNIGENSGTKTVKLVVNDTTVDSSSVSLNSDEQTVVSLTWDTTGYVPDIYDIELNTGDSSSVRNIIIDGSWLDVSNLTTDGPVTEGETLTASADVTNIGRTDVTDAISFTVDSNTLDSTNVTLDVQETQNLTFSWDTVNGDAGDHTVEIASTDDSESASVSVQDGAFTLTLDTINVVEGA
jgi:hypothetical protein